MSHVVFSKPNKRNLLTLDVKLLEFIIANLSEIWKVIISISPKQ